MYKTPVLFALLSLMLSACGASSSSGVSIPEQKPMATEVAFEGEYQVGKLLSGHYQFTAGTALELDGSDLVWENSSGTELFKGKEYTPGDDVAGQMIRFCVIPIHRGDRLFGVRSCSDYYEIAAQSVELIPRIYIANRETNSTVGAPLTAFVDADYGLAYHYQWQRNGSAITGETGPRNLDGQLYLLTVADEGQQIKVCIFADDDNRMLSCSLATNKIVPRLGREPEVVINTWNDDVRVGNTLLADYRYSDIDGDIQDSLLTTVQWQLNGVVFAANNSLLLTSDMALKTVSVCVTPYAVSGVPKAGSQTCSTKEMVLKKETTLPSASALAISGIAMAGQQVKASYQFFDANGDVEADSDLIWYVNDNEVSRNTIYTLREEDEGKDKELKLCITPKSVNDEVGSVVCKTQPVAWIKASGALTHESVISPELLGYPDFNGSWWRAIGVNSDLKNLIKFGENQFKPWSGRGFMPSVVMAYRPIEFCVLSINLVGEEVELCRELTRENGISREDSITGAWIDLEDSNRVGFDPKAKVDFNFNSENYTAYRPITWAEFSTYKDMGFNSAQKTNLIGFQDHVVGVTMKANDALAFCRRTQPNAKVATQAMLEQLFLTGDEFSLYNFWTNIYDLPWLVSDGKGIAKPLVYPMGESVILDVNQQYFFSCVTKNGAIWD